jgi:hypothetical protein
MMPEITTHLLQPIPLTPESIKPFGEALTSDGREQLTLVNDDELGYHGTIDGFRSDLLLESDAPVEFLMPRFRMREFRVLFMERRVGPRASGRSGGEWRAVARRPTGLHQPR